MVLGMDEIDYVLTKLVGKSPDCWYWLGQIDKKGFTRFKSLSATRFIYKELVGPLAKNIVLSHTCHNSACVNPEHLRPFTRRLCRNCNSSKYNKSPSEFYTKNELQIIDYIHALATINSNAWY